jgi:hypothetical protein
MRRIGRSGYACPKDREQPHIIKVAHTILESMRSSGLVIERSLFLNSVPA